MRAETWMIPPQAKGCQRWLVSHHAGRPGDRPSLSASDRHPLVILAECCRPGGEDVCWGRTRGSGATRSALAAGGYTAGPGAHLLMELEKTQLCVPSEGTALTVTQCPTAQL